MASVKENRLAVLVACIAGGLPSTAAVTVATVQALDDKPLACATVVDKALDTVKEHPGVGRIYLSGGRTATVLVDPSDAARCRVRPAIAEELKGLP